jgi:transcriptional regulator with XRE-family HTH domain
MPVKVRKITKVEIDVPDLPEQIAQARLQSGKSVKEVCEATEISRTFWNRLISGKEESIAYPTIQKFERFFGTDFGIRFEED